jgi:hypothetical protein
MQSAELHKLLKEHTLERDRVELSTGDVLDVKAGLLLIMLIFLAQQIGTVFQGSLSTSQRLLEAVSITGLVIGGLLAIVQLLPKKYSVLSSPSKYEKWLYELRKHYAADTNPEAEVLVLAERTEISQAIERVQKNEALNKGKVRLIKICFFCVMASFAANIATIAFRHLSPLHR